MKNLLIAVACLALAACGGSSSPSGVQNDSVSNVPALQPVSSAIPLDERLSVGGLDSTSPVWDFAITNPLNSPAVCSGLSLEMVFSRGAADQYDGEGTDVVTIWYYEQGYTYTIDSRGPECLAEDFRFAPIFESQ